MSVVFEELTEPIDAASAHDHPTFLRRLMKRRLAQVCLAYLFFLVLVAIIAPIIFPDIATQRTGNLDAVGQGPSVMHWLGTDSLGRDVLQRILVGTRITLVGVVQALLVALALGVPLGLVSGYFGRWVGRVTTWVTDLVFAMPGIIIILVVLAVFPQSMTAAMVTLGVLVAPGLVRVVRSTVLPVKEELYISAARVSGLSNRYIVFRHVFPRVVGPMIVQTSLIAATVLIAQTGLAFLGLIVAPPAPSWGGMIAEGIQKVLTNSWLIWPPGIAVTLATLVLGLLGDAARDAAAEVWSNTTPNKQPRCERDFSNDDEEAVTCPDALLNVSGLSVTFGTTGGTRLRVVERASFDIRRGEFLGLVGESGCGKSATAMAILDALPGSGQVQSGRIIFDGVDLLALGSRELSRIRGKRIAVISQEPISSLNPAFRIGWQLAEVVRQHTGMSKQQADERVQDLLRQVELSDPEVVMRRYPHELSGGMAQRVVIARALAGEPELLIADEPTTALDVTVQADVLRLLRRLQLERQMSILLITHDWGVVADVCDRAVVMYAGEVVEVGEVDEVFAEAIHPYTRGLLASNPHRASQGKPLPSIRGSVPPPNEWPTGCHFRTRCDFATPDCAAVEPVPIRAFTPSHHVRCIRTDELVEGTDV